MNGKHFSKILACCFLLSALPCPAADVYRSVTGQLFNVQKSLIWLDITGQVTAKIGNIIILKREVGRSDRHYVALTNYAGLADYGREVRARAMCVGDYQFGDTPMYLWDCGTPAAPPNSNAPVGAPLFVYQQLQTISNRIAQIGRDQRRDVQAFEEANERKRLEMEAGKTTSSDIARWRDADSARRRPIEQARNLEIGKLALAEFELRQRYHIPAPTRTRRQSPAPKP